MIELLLCLYLLLCLDPDVRFVLETVEEEAEAEAEEEGAASKPSPNAFAFALNVLCIKAARWQSQAKASPMLK